MRTWKRNLGWRVVHSEFGDVGFDCGLELQQHIPSGEWQTNSVLRVVLHIMIFPTEATIQTQMATVAWGSWTPTWSAGGGTLTTITLHSARHRVLGKFCEFYVRLTATNIGTATFDLRFTLPFTGVTSGTFSGQNETNNNLLEGISTSTHGIMWTVVNTFPTSSGHVLSVSGRFRIA